MKKLLFAALAIATIVGCKKSVNTIPEVEPVQEGLIQLSTGSVASRAANAGLREVFEAGDQIGVVATTLKVGSPAPTTPIDWADAVLHINNKPAAWLSNSTPEDPAPVISTFKWGPKGEGGLAHDQFYPKKDSSLSLFAYYPYTSNTDSLVYDATTKIPSLLITLKDGNVGTPVGESVEGEEAEVVELDANVKQADVLWAKGVSVAEAPLDYVSRLDPLAVLDFKHALAQINFKVTKSADAADCFFDQIEFQTYKKGSLDITTGAVTLTAPSAPADDVAADSAKYVIIDNQEGQITPEGLDIITTGKPLMVLPTTTADESKICKIRLRVNYGTLIKPDLMWYDVATDAIKPFLQGQLNTITLALSRTGVALTAKISPWVANDTDDDAELPVE